MKKQLPASPVSATQFVDNLVAGNKLTKTDASVLNLFLKSKDGYLKEGVCSFFASYLITSMENVKTSILNLSIKGYIKEIEATGRYIFDYEKFNIDKDCVEYFNNSSVIVENHMEAHSSYALKTLRELCCNLQNKTVYLFIVMTDPDVFLDIFDFRTDNGLKTILFMPAKNNIQEEKHKNYSEVYGKWVTLFHDKNDKFKKLVKLYTVKNNYKYLWSSCLTEKTVRFNCYEYHSGTTRYGNILQTNNDTTLYDLVKREYQKAYQEKIPMKEFERGRWLYYRYILPYSTKILLFIIVFLAAICCILDMLIISGIFSMLIIVVSFISNDIQNWINKKIELEF